MQRTTDGWVSGLIGVIIFSGSLPATRVAVASMTPLFLTSARAVIAAVIGAVLLLALRQTRPARSDLPSLAIVGFGVVVGFPLLTALALRHITSAHSIVFIGLLPLATAIFGVLRGGERPKAAFWFFSILGSLSVAAFALSQSGAASLTGDLLMVAAILVCGLGYAEGAVLSRRLGGWQVICWALVLSAPVLVPVVALRIGTEGLHAGPDAWLGFAYVALVSMFLAFFPWYRGLALGGIARIGQIQLAQPVLTLCWAALLLGEAVTLATVVAALAVLASVVATQATRRRTPAAASRAR
jgi:drug/metabolite transporter (DMT)-like permease